MEPLTKKDFEDILEQKLEQKLETKLTEQSKKIEATMSGIAIEITNFVEEKFVKLGTQLDLKFMDLKGGLKSEFAAKQQLQDHILAGHQ